MHAGSEASRFSLSGCCRGLARSGLPAQHWEGLGRTEESVLALVVELRRLDQYFADAVPSARLRPSTPSAPAECDDSQEEEHRAPGRQHQRCHPAPACNAQALRDRPERSVPQHDHPRPRGCWSPGTDSFALRLRQRLGNRYAVRQASVEGLEEGRGVVVPQRPEAPHHPVRAGRRFPAPLATAKSSRWLQRRR
jgi:hypothetical protein